jgi:hypothetical protein
MASAAITVYEYPATIETDTNAALITKDPSKPSLEGELVCGATATFLVISVTDAAATGVAVTSAQAQYQYPLKANEIFPWLPHYTSIQHKSGGTGVIAWRPIRRVD